MTQDEIISMAREAEVPVRGHYDEQGLTPQELERFANIAAAAEREACAQVCDEWIKNGSTLAEDIAYAIRARGEE